MSCQELASWGRRVRLPSHAVRMTGVSERLQASVISWPQSKRQKKKQLHTATSAEARQPLQIVTTIDAAIRQLDVRLHGAGLTPSDVPRDGSCYFHVIKFWLVHFIGAPAVMRLLGSSGVSTAAVRKFCCDWAEKNALVVIDDEGEDTVKKLAVRAALHDWPTPIDLFPLLPEEDRLSAQFGQVILRMRDGEWADDFWVRTLTPAALGFPVSIYSSAGPEFDREPQSLPRRGGAWGSPVGGSRISVENLV